MASLALPIGLISSLNRAEELMVPKCPFDVTNTAAPPAAVDPLIPADKGGVNSGVADSDRIVLACDALDTEADIDVATASEIPAGKIA